MLANPTAYVAADFQQLAATVNSLHDSGEMTDGSFQQLLPLLQKGMADGQKVYQQYQQLWEQQRQQQNPTGWFKRLFSRPSPGGSPASYLSHRMVMGYQEPSFLTRKHLGIPNWGWGLGIGGVAYLLMKK